MHVSRMTHVAVYKLQRGLDVQRRSSWCIKFSKSCCAFRDLLDGKIPSDLALLQDADIRQYVEQYATDQVRDLCQITLHSHS